MIEVKDSNIEGRFKMDCRTIYNGIKKCVNNDFPFRLIWDDKEVYPFFEECYSGVLEEHSHINNSYYSNEQGGIIRLEYIDHYVILCYRFSNRLGRVGRSDLADAVYYSMRVRGAIDLYYRTEIGRCFMPVHALGTVMDSHAVYGEYFKVYNGCHIGPYSFLGKDAAEWEHPVFGDFVTMLGHSKVFGASKIGTNVIISAQTLVINEEIPDNCIVSGSSPNLFFQKIKVSNRELKK